MYVRTYVRMYVCMYVWMYGCMHVCMYACMYVCMYVCIYIYIYISGTIYSKRVLCTVMGDTSRNHDSNSEYRTTFYYIGTLDPLGFATRRPQERQLQLFRLLLTTEPLGTCVLTSQVHTGFSRVCLQRSAKGSLQTPRVQVPKIQNTNHYILNGFYGFWYLKPYYLGTRTL